MNSVPTVLLTGATAQVGLHMLRILLNARVNVVAFSRRVESPERIGHPSGASLLWFHPEQYRALISTQQISTCPAGDAARIPAPEWLISAGPIGLATGWLESCSSLKRVVCLSTSSVLSKANSADPAEKKQIEEILQAEHQLGSVCSARDLDLVILRPTLIYGCGMDENISRMAQFIRRFGFIPVAGAASGLRQPVHVADLAELMVAITMTTAVSGTTGQNCFEVAGGSTLSYRAMTVKVFQALGKPVRILIVPPGFLAVTVVLAKKLPAMKGLNTQMIARQNQDLVFDDHEVRQRFDFQPRGFDPGPEDFSLPVELKLLLPEGLRGT